jgi:hypothetical protein
MSMTGRFAPIAANRKSDVMDVCTSHPEADIAHSWTQVSFLPKRDMNMNALVLVIPDFAVRLP